MSRIGADLVVEVALKHERAERSRVIAELCAGDAELERLARELLSHYDRPAASLPAGPFPCDLGPFTLERELGAGAHGKVYLARRPPLDGYVAVKLLRPVAGMGGFVEQVRREAGRARRIPSPNVVPVFDAGRVDGGPFYVEMAVCADPDDASPGSIRIGGSLRDARAGLSPRDAARIVEDLARAVEAAHRTGVIHGDVKPENALITPATRRVMLADFGLATTLVGGAAPGSTPVGTIEYMAPEQWRDRLSPSEASDVYGLGGTLYFLLAGVAPHAARGVDADASPPPLPTEVPQRLREIAMRALAADPAERPSSAGALADELRRFRANEPTWHDRRSAGRRLLLFARRHLRELETAAALLAVLLPLVLVGYQVFTGQVRELARRETSLRTEIGDLERARRGLERDTARLEGEADAKQRELARVESRLQQLPKLDQALGAARAQAEAARAEAEAVRAQADRSAAEERHAAERVAALEGEVARAREALARATEELGRVSAREVAALREAARAAGELGEVRARLASAEAEVAAARRAGEERRNALEAELRQKDNALATARAAARPAQSPHAVAPAGEPFREPRAVERAAPGAARKSPDPEAARARKGADPGSGEGPGQTGTR